MSPPKNDDAVAAEELVDYEEEPEVAEADKGKVRIAAVISEGEFEFLKASIARRFPPLPGLPGGLLAPNGLTGCFSYVCVGGDEKGVRGDPQFGFQGFPPQARAAAGHPGLRFRAPFRGAA
jgi:hypothetical protein